VSERNPTAIGRVRHVLGATVTVELDAGLAGVEPLWEGRLLAVGQVGSLVRIPQGPLTLFAAVTLVGIAELSNPTAPSFVPQTGDRWLQVQLIGEQDGLGRFARGVSRYPGIDDEVHFTTSRQLAGIYPPPSSERIRLGRLSASPEVPVTLNAASLVMRHSAIVGSTGSGKTSAVASLLQRLASGGWDSANIVVIDPHGEYSRSLASIARVRSVLGHDSELLRVPYWALPAGDILRAFCGSVESATTTTRFGELCAVGRREFANTCQWLNLEPASISSDTPIPFDLRQVWYRLQYDNCATYEKGAGVGEPQLIDAGSAEELRAPVFKPYSIGSAAPFKGPLYSVYSTVPDRLRVRLLDDRFRFFREPVGKAEGVDPLVMVVDEWLGGDKAVSVLDFSGVPGEATDLAVGAVLQILFELAVRSRIDGIGRPRPVLVILEEAHRYLGEGSTVRLAREAANRIAREGRKYGIGLTVVTQRPSELPPTALSQCGTIIALRLTNGTDQGTVKAALPDSVAGLADVLPSLRTGEAIISGEAVTLPTRALIDMPSPAPDAADPTLEPWRRPAAPNSLSGAVSRWRRT
jgi:uncharacterized protein